MAMAAVEVETNPCSNRSYPYLMYPSVLKNVFQYLDSNSLKECRKVCTLWADVGIKELCKKTCITLDFPPSDIYKKKIEKLIDMSELAPPEFFQNIVLDYSWLDNEEWMEEAKNWLTNHEMYFKSLEIQINGSHRKFEAFKLFTILNKRCPNLETFKLYVLNEYRDNVGDPVMSSYHYNWFGDVKHCKSVDKYFSFSSSLNLKTIHLNGGALHFLPRFSACIVKASPYLIELHTRFAGTPMSMQMFYKEISRTDVFAKLRELRWDTSFSFRYPSFKTYSSTNKISVLGLGMVYEKHNLFDVGSEISMYLGPVKRSLKVLILDQSTTDENLETKECLNVLGSIKAECDTSSDDDDDQTEAAEKYKSEQFWQRFDRMDKLEEFHMKSLIFTLRGISIRCLSQYFPNLKVLKIGSYCQYRDLEQFLQPYGNEEDCHRNLKVLHMIGKLQNPEYIQTTIARCFPNMQEILITAETLVKMESYLQTLLNTNLKNIKKLILVITADPTQTIGWTAIMNLVKLFEELETFAIHVVGWWMNIDDLKISLQAPKLKKIEIAAVIERYNNRMPVAAKKEILELASRNNIQFEMVKCVLQYCCEPSKYDSKNIIV